MNRKDVATYLFVFLLMTVPGLALIAHDAHADAERARKNCRNAVPSVTYEQCLQDPLLRGD